MHDFALIAFSDENIKSHTKFQDMFQWSKFNYFAVKASNELLFSLKRNSIVIFIIGKHHIRMYLFQCPMKVSKVRRLCLKWVQRAS